MVEDDRKPFETTVGNEATEQSAANGEDDNYDKYDTSVSNNH